MHSFYPLNINIRGKKCLVVGGGKTAERKVSTLLRYGGKVVLVSPEATDTIRKYHRQKQITWHQRKFRFADLKGTLLVFSATSDKTLNKTIGRKARRKSILVNVVDDPQECDFISPSLVERGYLTVSISTGGTAPLIAKQIRQDLEEYFGREYCRYTELVAKVRHIINTNNNLSPQEKRKKIKQFLSLNILDQLAQGKKVSHTTILKRLGVKS